MTDVRIARRWTRVAAGLAGAALLHGCGKAGGGPRGDMAVPVVAVKARVQPVAQTISVVGTLEANEVVEIKNEIDGTIAAIPFEEGQPVTAGQPLVQIDAMQLRASLAQAEANLTLAEATRQRYQALIDAGAVSRQEVDQALAQYDAQHAGVDLMREQLADATIVAPFDGVVGARHVSVGQYIPVGTTLTWLIDGDPMKLEFRVPERVAGRLQPDQDVQLRLDAYPDETFTGRIYFVDPQIDVQTRTALAKAILPNPDGRLHRGMFADVTVTIDTNPQAVVIPETAVQHDDELTTVYVVEHDQAQPRPVHLGTRLPGQVEVTEGLQAGEVVVIEGIQKLRPGAHVLVREPGPEPTVPATAAAPRPAAR